jgi:hypothetical protein
MDVFKTLEIMKEYFTAARFEERPYRAQRCLYSLKALHVYGYDRFGAPRYSSVAREMLGKQISSLTDYLEQNPVAAWDWVVSWTECRAMAEAFPDEFRSMFRRLRSLYDTKRKQKPELQYFLAIMSQVAKEHMIDMERR